MLKSATAFLLSLTLVAPLSAFAADDTSAGSQTRPLVQFVYRSTFFGLNPIDVPVDPRSNQITDTVHLIGGGMDGQAMQITGSNNVSEWVRRYLTRSGSNHPNANIIHLFSDSQAASNELRAADAAASNEDHHEVWGAILAGAAAIPLGFASATPNQELSTNPLLYAGVGLGISSAVFAIWSVRDRFDSWNHLGRAVSFWNQGK